ncbi:galactonate dehydratase [Bryobacterales bacterium F-183]|nr:galactonate dehydratase [Bryobacterales bacterium F-183]
MKVKGITFFPVKQPGDGQVYTLLKITTDTGAAVGWGECETPATGGELSLLTSLVANEPVSRFEVLRTRMATGKVRPDLISGVLMALADALARSAKAPVYQLLAGPTRNKVRALTQWSEAAARAGHKAFVTGPDYDQKDGFDFVVDGGAKMTPIQASLLAVALEKKQPLWLDEPCGPTGAGALRKISEESVTPIGWGLQATSLATFQDLLREQVADVIRPSLRRFDLWSIRKAAALAETYYTAVAPGPGLGPVSTAAALHLAASLPNFFIQQVPWSSGEDAKMRAEIVGLDVEAVKDGYFALPTGPGLGLTVNENALRRYAA